MSTSTMATAALARVVADQATVAGRDDLAHRAAGAAARLEAPRRQILVTGAFKQGKSSLVNGLLGADVTPVDDDVATAVPVVVSHGASLQASLVVEEPDAAPGDASVRRGVSLKEARRAVVGRQDPPVRWVGVQLPRRLLERGVVVVDTPGVGGLDAPAGTLAIRAAGASSVVVVVSDATQELTGSELRFLRLASQSCPRVVLALTKTDLSRHWPKIAELDRSHLSNAGLDDVVIVPTSAPLRRLALERGDGDLNRRSGYPVLTRALLDHLDAASEPTGVLDELDDIVGQLFDGAVRVRQALADPGSATDLAGALADARHRADELRRGSARWHQLLNDGIGTLASDAEYDLRTRLRAVVREIELAIDAGDPAETWDGVQELLGQRASDELSAHHGVVSTGAQGVARAVAEHFASVGATLTLDRGPIDAQWSAAVDLDPGQVELSRAGVSTKVMTALRGSYGSVMMFGLVSTFVGFALINPVTIAAGVGMGRKALRDERDRQLAQRRAAAKQAVRKVIDDVTLAETKRSRDAVRQVHHAMRDGFAARAEELQRALDEAARAAERAVRTSATELQEQVAALDVRLEQLSALRRDLDARRTEVTGALERPTTAGV